MRLIALLLAALWCSSAAAFVQPAPVAGAPDPNNSLGNQPSGDVGPVLIGGSTYIGLGTFQKVPFSLVQVGSDAFSNPIEGLAVKDYSQGTSNSFGGAAGPPQGVFTNGSGNQEWSPSGNSIFIDVSGTWTGSLTMKQQLSTALPTVNLRQVGTGTLVSSITANGLYAIEGELPDDLIFTNGIATGELDVFAVSIAGYTSGFYAHQGGVWNLTNITGTVSLPTGASTAANQTTIDGHITSAQPRKIQDSAGNALTSTSSALDVNIKETLIGTPVNQYNTTASLQPGQVTYQSYAIGSGKTFHFRKLWATSTGRIRADLQTSPNGSTYTTYWTTFNSVAEPNINLDLGLQVLTTTGVGSTVRVAITNLETKAFDVYSTIMGSEF